MCGVTYDVIGELRHLSLSKSCPALCHKLVYEIAIFHSINGETCDKVLYVRYNCHFVLHVLQDFQITQHWIM